MPTNEETDKHAPNMKDVLDEVTKIFKATNADKTPLTPTEFNEGITALKLLTTTSVSTLSIVDFMLNQLEKFPNSEEKTILKQKLTMEALHQKLCIDANTGLISHFLEFTVSRPGVVRYLIKQGKAATCNHIVEVFENARKA